MKKVIKLTEKDLTRIVKRVIKESMWASTSTWDDLSSDRKINPNKENKKRGGRQINPKSHRQQQIARETGPIRTPIDVNKYSKADISSIKLLESQIDYNEIIDMAKEFIKQHNDYATSGKFHRYSLDQTNNFCGQLMKKIVNEKFNYLVKKYGVAVAYINILHHMVYQNIKQMTNDFDDLDKKIDDLYYIYDLDGKRININDENKDGTDTLVFKKKSSEEIDKTHYPWVGA